MKAITKSQLINILHNAYGFGDEYDMLITHESMWDENTFTLQDSEGEQITCLFEGAEVEGSLLRVIEDVTGDLKVLTVLVPVAAAIDLMVE